MLKIYIYLEEYMNLMKVKYCMWSVTFALNQKKNFDNQGDMFPVYKSNKIIQICVPFEVKTAGDKFGFVIVIRKRK